MSKTQTGAPLKLAGLAGLAIGLGIIAWVVLSLFHSVNLNLPLP